MRFKNKKQKIEKIKDLNQKMIKIKKVEDKIDNKF